MAWKKFRAHWVFTWVVLGVYIFSQITFSVLDEGATDHEEWSFLVSLVSLIVAVGMGIGLTRLFLDLIDTDTEGKISTYLLVPKKMFWSYLGATVLYMLLVGIGFMLIIPGIYFMLKYQFFGELIVDKKLGAIEALKKSAEMTSGVKWQLLGFILGVAGVNVLGALVFGFGLFVTVPVTALAYYLVYRKLSLRLESLLPATSSPVSSGEVHA